MNEAPEVTYRDGVGVERCALCRRALRGAAEEPLTSVRWSDLESVVRLLVEYVDCPAVWADTIRRFEQALGRTHKQITGGPDGDETAADEEGEEAEEGGVSPVD